MFAGARARGRRVYAVLSQRRGGQRVWGLHGSRHRPDSGHALLQGLLQQQRTCFTMFGGCMRVVLLFALLFVHLFVNFRVCKTLMTSVLYFQGVDDVSAVCCVCRASMTSALFVVFAGRVPLRDYWPTASSVGHPRWRQGLLRFRWVTFIKAPTSLCELTHAFCSSLMSCVLYWVYVSTFAFIGDEEVIYGVV